MAEGELFNSGIDKRYASRANMIISILFVIGAVAFVGCASNSAAKKVDAKTIDWKQKIGTYSYDQALADLGKPAVVTESADGKTAEWVLKKSPRMSLGFGVGGGSYGSGSGVGVGVGTETPLPAHGENLRLTFNAFGKLKEWTKLKY
ncbi:MAG TPA: hypothetical protein VNT99_10255 [Methylomirabilota bacterium]|nr:hypothetical protein [Methylomirabilota bacterium]